MHANLVVLAAATLTLGGCATAKAITGPDGTPHQLITCGDIEMCYSKATEVCGGKYKIVNTSSDVSGSKEVTSTTNRMLVKCDKGF